MKRVSCALYVLYVYVFATYDVSGSGENWKCIPFYTEYITHMELYYSFINNLEQNHLMTIMWLLTVIIHFFSIYRFTKHFVRFWMFYLQLIFNFFKLRIDLECTLSVVCNQWKTNRNYVDENFPSFFFWLYLSLSLTLSRSRSRIGNFF